MSGEKKVRRIVRRADKTMVLSKEETSTNSNVYIPVVEGAKIKIIPLGGNLENGNNCWVIEHENEIIILDAGGKNTDISLSNYEPLNIDYLIKNKNKIKALILSHGHDDQIGSVKELVSKVNIPKIYGAPLTLKLLEINLKREGYAGKLNTEPIKQRQTIKFTNLALTCVKNTHTIPDSYSLIIHTPAGKVIYTGDFKFDFTPVDKEQFDIHSFAKAGEEGVLLLISDSTNIRREHPTPSESSVYSTIQKMFHKAFGRVVISVMHSHVFRINQIIKICEEEGRKLVVLDEKIQRIIEAQKDIGNLKFIDKVLIDPNELENTPDRRVCVLTSVSQGDDISEVWKMAKGEHSQIELKEKDTVLISAAPIQGGEKHFSELIDMLSYMGVTVKYERGEKIFVEGHAGRAEQRLLLNLTRPKFFIPAKGEYGNLSLFRRIANECGMEFKDTFILKNGDELELTSKSSNHKRIGRKAVESLESEFGDLLKSKGLVTIYATVKSKKLLTKPLVDVVGLVELINDSEKEAFVSLLQKESESVINKLLKSSADNIQDEVKKELTSIIKKELKSEPIVQVAVLESH